MKAARKKTADKKGGGAKKARAAGSAKKGAPAGGRRKAAAPAQAVPAGHTKRYLKSKPVCKVTFRLPAEAAPGSSVVSIVGDFNGWNHAAGVMKRLRDGSFSLTLDLETGRDYRFRYLIDESRWENDWHADRYEPNAYGSDDSIIAV